MSYRPKPSMNYVVKKPVKAKTLYRLSAKALAKPKTAAAQPSSMVANVHDVANFLARYISGAQNVILSTGRTSGFSVEPYKTVQGKKYHLISAPAWQSFDLPVKGFDRYRIYRFGIFHEACHVKYTPSLLYEVKDLIIRDLVNIIEDKRVEEKGVKEWPGYLPERLYGLAYGYALRPKVDTVSDQSLRRIEAFMQGLLLGKVKGRLNPLEKQLVEEAVKDAEDTLKKLENETNGYVISGEIISSAQRIKKLLNIDKPAIKSSRSDSPWDDTFTPQYAREHPEKPEEVEKGVEEFYREKKKEAKAKRGKEKEKPTDITEEDIEQSRRGSAEVLDEYQRIQRMEKVAPELRMWMPVASQGPVAEFRDAKFISAMNTYLQSWREGFVRIVGRTGAELSVKEYIKHKDTPFVTKLKQSVKGKKLLILADFSGSMHDREQDYKKALISSLEVLDSIGCNIALFTFASDPAQGSGFYRVKTFEEPKLTKSHMAKVAGLIAAYPSTPTSEAYQRLQSYIAKHRPEVTVTITDGEPDDAVETATAVQKLKPLTKMVAFGIAKTPNLREPMERDLKSFGYHKSFAVNQVHEIPPKLVNLLTA